MGTKAKVKQNPEQDQKISELEELVKRMVADYHNLENRMQEERKSMGVYATSELLKRLLPAFDTLFLAEKYTNDQGVKLTVKQLIDSLKNEGVERVATTDVDFNPALMECIEVVDGKENKVIDEVSPGFVYGEKLLRAAKVKVGSGKNPDTIH